MSDMNDETRIGDGHRTRCEEAIRLLAAYLDGELEEGEQAAVRHHLETCRHCFSRAEFEKKLRAQLAELRQTRPTPGLEDRIRTLIHGFPAS